MALDMPAGRTVRVTSAGTRSPVRVPEDLAVPDGLMAAEFWLAPLGPQHNEADYAAWTATIDHIRETPGSGGRSWPRQMSLDDNLRNLKRHAQDFAAHRAFTYTVLSADAGDVIGCEYIYPPRGRRPGDRPMRRSDPGCAPPAPRSPRSCTTRCWHGWNAPPRT
jgi:hypothetical protein